MKNIFILTGGPSSEHEVSLQSALSIVNAIDRSEYTPQVIGIDKSGRWYWYGEADFCDKPDDPANISLKKTDTEVLPLPASQGELIDKSNGRIIAKADAVLPALHGTFGEDGQVQGILSAWGVPYVGSGIAASALCFDKALAKDLLTSHGLAVGNYLVIASKDKAPSYEEAAAKLGKSIFIKPARQGSSVGVSKVTVESDWQSALTTAFTHDSKVITEQAQVGREIECAVLGNDTPKAAWPGEVKAKHDFYSYDAKYIDADGAELIDRADLPAELADKIKNIAIDAYLILGCEGLARVDFFLTEQNDIILNEINTMPGFTKISMYPRMWQSEGLGYGELIDRLIKLA